MLLSRYSFSSVIGGKYRSTSESNVLIFKAAESGTLKCKIVILEEGKRIDSIAGAAYGDSRLWWVIAAASGVGWALQAPPGTVLRVPLNITQVFGLIA